MVSRRPALLAPKPTTPRPARSRKNPEGIIQKAIVRYLRAVLPHGFIVQATANKPRSQIAGAVERSMGAIKGWPDLTIWGQSSLGEFALPRAWHLEVKVPGGKARPEQVEVHDKLKDLGFAVAVVRSIEDVRAFLHEHRIPNKEEGGR